MLTIKKILVGKYAVIFLILTLLSIPRLVFSQGDGIVWTSQSKNSSGSMPVGGGDIGLNVWVENNEIYAYIARSGTFDENNSLLKLGRIRLRISPNPFDGETFRQELVPKDGYIAITGQKGKLNVVVKIWAEVFDPIIHFDVKANQLVLTEASYETWRFEDRILEGTENNQNSYKWAPQGIVKTLKDRVAFTQANEVEFYHQNKDTSIFDVTVKQQGLEAWKNQLYNPLKDLIFGGKMMGQRMVQAGVQDGTYLNLPFRAWKLKGKSPARETKIQVVLNTAQTSLSQWKQTLSKSNSSAGAEKNSKTWWNNYWDRSFIDIRTGNDEVDQLGRNYRLFRYMLGCNAYGSWPTKFNGGLFTFDPQFTDTSSAFTPDYRRWGGGIHTAQNQRLVYWPMLKGGDFDLMKPQFDFYLRLLKNAELRSEVYWQHKGASFTEQLENFGLPNSAEYGWKRPKDFDQGLEYNAWLEYEWDTVLEFCQMIIETERYNNNNIKAYLPLIESCLTFFRDHYVYLAKKRGSRALDANGHLVLYPGSGAETYKMAYNSTSTISALQQVLTSLIASPSLTAEQKVQWETMLKTIPPITFREFGGRTTIAPAKAWERINNTEPSQLYPVFPWGIFGVGRPGLDTAINTYQYDTDVLKFRSHVGWKQDLIFAARLGLTAEAKRLVMLKLKDSGKRFPAFWGPGFDWTPDHNWGGSGMIGLQEMLMQCVDQKILLFPAWPKEWDVHFKLHAPDQTTVEGTWKNGRLESLKVIPERRRKDVVIQ